MSKVSTFPHTKSMNEIGKERKYSLKKTTHVNEIEAIKCNYFTTNL